MGQTVAISGFGGSVTISSSAVTEVTEWNGTINVNTADVTPLSASGWINRINTTSDFSGTFTANKFLNLTSGNPRNAVFAVGASAGATTPTITCRIYHSTGVTVPGDAVEWSYDFESDGPLAIAVA